MSEIKDGGPAFPCRYEDLYASEGKIINSGMSLRDWFAGQVMPKAMSIVTNFGGSPECMTSQAAKFAYQYADAMIKERVK